ncbi:TPA: hypothetical protein ACK3J3_001929 [Mannheimia haemolytica]
MQAMASGGIENMRAIEMMANIVKTKKPHLLPDFLEMLDELEVQFKKEFK